VPVCSELYAVCLRIVPQGLSSGNASSRENYDGNIRLVDAASGWHAADVGDILSSHSYPAASVPNCSAAGMQQLSLATDSRGHYALPHCKERVLVNSEFGGLCLAPSAIGLPEWFDAGHAQFFGNDSCAGVYTQPWL
jgi:hypothetical protein